MSASQILILEDDDLLRAVLVETLERAGYSPVAVGNGVEGLARLPDIDPRLILLDMLMPKMDGFEFLARLRKNPRWAGIPVVIISDLGEALEKAIDRRGGETLGVVGIVPKSTWASELLERIRSAIGPGGGDAR